MKHHGRKRNDNKAEFPPGLVILGLLVGVLAWVCLFTPEKSHKALMAQTYALPESRAEQPVLPAADQPPQTSEQLKVVPSQDLLENEQGNIYQYTDESGIVHLIDNPDKIPPRYRSRTTVHKDAPSSGRTTRVRIVNNQVLVPVTLRNGERTVQATLLLDTGCTMTTISATLAARLEIDPTRTTPGTARVADGRKVPCGLAVIDQLAAGPKSKAPLQVSVMTVAGPEGPADGLLGMNFLRDFRYQLDVAGQQIHWR